MRASTKGMLFWSAILTMPLAALVLIVGGFYILYSVNACITDLRREITVPSGLKFSIVETDCSTLGEDTSISIYGATADDRTLLLRYSPDSDRVAEITIADGDNIVISIPTVSSIQSMETSWRNRVIKYDVGHIDYP